MQQTEHIYIHNSIKTVKSIPKKMTKKCFWNFCKIFICHLGIVTPLNTTLMLKKSSTYSFKYLDNSNSAKKGCLMEKAVPSLSSPLMMTVKKNNTQRMCHNVWSECWGR